MISNSQPSHMDRRTATTIFPLVDSSMNLIQYSEDDIPNYSSTVMFRGTPCSSVLDQNAIELI